VLPQKRRDRDYALVREEKMLKLTSSREIDQVAGTDSPRISTFVQSAPQKTFTGRGLVKNPPIFFSDSEIAPSLLPWKIRRTSAWFFESIAGILEVQDVNFLPFFFIRYGIQQRTGKRIP